MFMLERYRIEREIESFSFLRAGFKGRRRVNVSEAGS